jgi:hypothetical protein
MLNIMASPLVVCGAFDISHAGGKASAVGWGSLKSATLRTGANGNIQDKFID